MSAILLPIKPNWAQKILSGEKTVELRRVMPSRNPRHLLIYETAPTSAVVGEISILCVAQMPPSGLRRYMEHAQVTPEEFDAYFVGSEFGVAFFVHKPVRFTEPIKLSSVPQGMVYADNVIELSGRFQNE